MPQGKLLTVERVSVIARTASALHAEKLRASYRTILVGASLGADTMPIPLETTGSTLAPGGAISPHALLGRVQQPQPATFNGAVCLSGITPGDNASLTAVVTGTLAGRLAATHYG